MNNTRVKTDEAKNNELEPVKHTKEHAPAFETDIDPIKVLETLDGFIESLSENQSEENIEAIKNRLATMALIAVVYEKDHEKSWWMSTPVTLNKYEMKRSMGKRIGHLLKSGGEWKGETVHKENVEAKSYSDLPMTIEITADAAEGLAEKRIPKLFVGLVGLHQTVSDMLERGEPSLGIFHKSDAIVHTNILKGWIQHTQNPNLIAMKDEIQAMTLNEVIESMTFSGS